MIFVLKMCAFLIFRQLRFTAYRQFSAWSHHYESLGKGNRVVIPSCVVGRIRGEFPEKKMMTTLATKNLSSQTIEQSKTAFFKATNKIKNILFVLVLFLHTGILKEEKT